MTGGRPGGKRGRHWDSHAGTFGKSESSGKIALSFVARAIACRIMTQDCRQALIELLFLSLYLDDHLSLAEDDVLSEALDSLGWESPNPREKFIFSAFSAAREAAACAIKTENYLAARVEVIKRGGEEGPALTWLSRVLGADGLTSSEQRFLGQLEGRLFP